MTLWSRVRSWVFAILRLSRTEREMDAELRFHIEAFAEDLVRSGVPSQEAMRRARLQLGSIERAKEECRDARGINAVETLIQDLRYALRTQRRSFGFTAVAVPTLALGIGAATSIFSVVKAVILNPLPFRQPENLVHIWEGFGADRYRRGDQPYFSTVQPGNFYDWRAQGQSFERISAYRSRSMLLTGSKQAELVSAHEVFDEFFETLGTPAQLGRTFEAADYAPSAPHVVVISSPMWANRFGKDPGVISRRISLDRESYEIVGVMPAGFYPTPSGYGPSAYPELWIPHWANQGEKGDRVTWGLIPVARLKAGVTWRQAQTELDVVSARIDKDHPPQKMHAVVVPVDAQLIGSSWKLFLLLSSGVTLLLLIACVNVANLLLARAVDLAQSRYLNGAAAAPASMDSPLALRQAWRYDPVEAKGVLACPKIASNFRKALSISSFSRRLRSSRATDGPSPSACSKSRSKS